MTMTKAKKSSPLEPPSTRILPDPAAARDHPAMAATGIAAAVVVVVLVASWHPSSASRATMSTRLRASSSIIFVIGADRQPVIFVIRALMIRETRHGPRCVDRAAPACPRVKDLAQTGQVVFCRHNEARGPPVRERLLGGEAGEAAWAVWVQQRMESFAVGCREPRNPESEKPIPGWEEMDLYSVSHTSSDTLFQYVSWKLMVASVVYRTTSFMLSDLKVYIRRGAYK
jgi:hypothetical protein